MSICMRIASALVLLSVFAVVTTFTAEVSFGQALSSDEPATPVVKPAATSTPDPSRVPAQTRIKVTFDEARPGVVIIESNGERVRVDTTSKSIENLAMEPAGNTSKPSDAPVVAANAPAADDDEIPDPYEFDRGEEPYDYRLINVPTPKNVPKGSWNLAFTHRFTQPLRPLSSSARGLLGLDSFGVASFGMTYGVTDKLYVSAYRSPLCQRGVCRVIEAGVGYNWVAQDADNPIAFTTYASIEGNDNFTEEFTYNLQAMLSARLGKRVYVFFSPAVHINSNGQRRFNPRADEFFPPATVAETFDVPEHTASFGFGTSVMITPNVVALFDFTPRTGFKLGRFRPVVDSTFRVVDFTHESHPSIGFGIQRNVGRHSFTLTFSNTQGTTTSRYNSSNLVRRVKDLIIGFNLSRRF